MIEPTGYTALDLIGFTDRGAYDPTANYVKNDIVTVGNTKWRCKIDDTTGVTPTENANWTIYLESATSLAGMDDTDITSPKDGDLVQFNSTSNKWENSDDVWATMAQNGAHNLLNNTATTQVVNGATFTMNSDGSITISGKHTHTGAQSIVLGYLRGVKAGDKFIVSGIASSFSSTSIDIRFYDSSDTTLTYTTYMSGELAITAPANTSYIKVTLWFNNQDFGAGVTIYPMMRRDTDPNTDYTPYVPTNRDCMSYAVNTKLGAKNLINNTLATQTISGVTITVNSTTGTMTVSSSNVTGTVDKTYCTRTLDTGRYRLSIGTISDKIQFYVNAYNGDTFVKQLGSISSGNNELYFSVDNNGYNNIRFGIYISSSAGTLTSKTYYPMLTVAEDTDPTYAPYAKTNRELTEEISKKNFSTREILTSGTEYTAPSDGYVVAMAQTANNTYYIEVNNIRVEAGWASSTSWGSGSIRVTKGMKCKPVGDACFFIPIV